MEQFDFLRAIRGPGRPRSENSIQIMGRILLHLRDVNDGEPSAEIARLVGISALRCSQLCDSLVEDGLIRISHNDRGGRLCHLTKTGKDKLCEAPSA
jgi:DNA-binding IscR family transcriptional regulator